MNDLDGYSAPCAEMCGAVDGTHSSLSEELLDLILVIE